MSKNSTVSLTLQIKGNGIQELKRSNDDQVKSAIKINQTWTQIGSAQAKFVNQARAGNQATVSTARVGDNLLRTHRMLEGVLRQQSIQTKLHSQHLKQQASLAQQQLAFMKQIEQSSKRTHVNAQQTASLWQKGAAIGGATVAGGMIVSSALQKPREYAEQMTYIATTATGGQGLSTDERLKKIGTLEQYVKDAVREGGGKREDVAAALNELIASGKYDIDNVKSALMSSSKTAFAAGADSVDAAKMTIAMQNFGVKDLNLAQDRSMRAGQLGSFEYRDMAKFLPEQMAAARASGYSGDQGLVKLLTLNQMAKSTSADSAGAGNNVVNLLQKLSSREFSDSIAKAVAVKAGDKTQLKGKKNPKEVFDWTSYAQDQRSNGVYGVEAFVKLLERQLGDNKQYQKLQSQAQSATTPEAKKAILGDMSNIALGSEIGQIIADRQALMAALAVVYNKDSSAQLESQISNAGGTVDADLATIKKTEWAKDQALNQEKLFAQSKAYDAVSESLGSVKESITKWAGNNENLAATAYTATVALASLAAAGGAAAILGGSKGGLLGKAGGAASGLGGMGAAARVGGQFAIAGAAGYGVGTGIRNMYMQTEVGQSFDDKLGATIAKTLAFFGNDEAQAAVDAQTAADAQAKYDQMIQQQEQANKLNSQMVRELQKLPSAIGNSIKIPPPSFDNLQTQLGVGDREGAVPYLLQRR